MILIRFISGIWEEIMPPLPMLNMPDWDDDWLLHWLQLVEFRALPLS
jgi:hypothetical protein